MGGQPGERSHALQKADEPQEGRGWQGLSYQNSCQEKGEQLVPPCGFGDAKRNRFES